MFETHRALPVLHRIIESTFDDGTPCDVEAAAADTRTLVAFDHGDLMGPGSLAEVAQHVAHLHVFGVCSRPSHVDTIPPSRVAPGRVRPPGKRLGQGKGPRRREPARGEEEELKPAPISVFELESVQFSDTFLWLDASRSVEIRC